MENVITIREVVIVTQASPGAFVLFGRERDLLLPLRVLLLFLLISSAVLVEVTPLALDMVLAIMKMVLVIVTPDGKDVIVINIILLNVVNFRYSPSC